MAFRGLAHLLGIGERPRLTPQEAYKLWADTYPPWPHNPLMQVEQAVVAPMMKAARPRRALDVGAGTGRGLPLLKAAGARFVVSADLSLAMLSQQAAGGRRICADACHLPFASSSFDLVTSSLMVGDVDDLGGWVNEAARMLARGGSLIYSDFHPSWSDRNWQRTFRTRDGRLIELEYYPHTIEQHLALIEAASLKIQTIREPRVAAADAPVVVVFQAVKL